MAGIPKIKITFDADFDELKKGVKGAQNEVEGFGSKVGDFAKKAGAAFALAGAAAAAYAGKLLVDGVKSAIADEAAQAKLATTLGNVTGATDAQIAAVEEQITKTSLLTGLTDDELRPSLDRLLRSTKSVEEAQRLQALAIDVAAGSGKSLEAVTNAMARAAEGNTTALGKLGVGLSAAQLKTMSMEQITASLAKTFEGQASKQADTFQGKMARLTVAFDEAKETVGSYVLDALTPLISGFVDKGIPAIQNFAAGLSETLGPAFSVIFRVIKEDLLPIITSFFNFLATEFIPALGAIFGPALRGLANAFTTIKNAVASNSEELNPLLTLFKALWAFTKDNLAPILGGALKLAFEGIAALIAGLITAFGKFVSLLTSVYNSAKKIIDLIKDNPFTDFFQGDKGKGLKAGGPLPDPMGDEADNGLTGFISPATGADIGVYSPAMQAAIRRREELKAETARLRAEREKRAAERAVNITVNGAIDPIATARQIANVLNTEATLSGTFSNLGTSRLVAI
jgi:phage-related protein